MPEVYANDNVVKIEAGRVTINRLLYGFVSKKVRGWEFIPAVAGRKTSRKGHPTMEACIPAWVRRRAKAMADQDKYLDKEIRS